MSTERTNLFTKNHKFAAEIFVFPAGIWTSRWLESLNLCISCSKQKLQTNSCFLRENIEKNRYNTLSKQRIHYRICKYTFRGGRYRLSRRSLGTKTSTEARSTFISDIQCKWLSVQMPFTFILHTCSFFIYKKLIYTNMRLTFAKF